MAVSLQTDLLGLAGNVTRPSSRLQTSPEAGGDAFQRALSTPSESVEGPPQTSRETAAPTDPAEALPASLAVAPPFQAASDPESTGKDKQTGDGTVAPASPVRAETARPVEAIKAEAAKHAGDAGDDSPVMTTQATAGTPAEAARPDGQATPRALDGTAQAAQPALAGKAPRAETVPATTEESAAALKASSSSQAAESAARPVAATPAGTIEPETARQAEAKGEAALKAKAPDRHVAEATHAAVRQAAPIQDPAGRTVPDMARAPEAAIAPAKAAAIAKADPKHTTETGPQTARKEAPASAWSAPSFADMPAQSEIKAPDRLFAATETTLSQGDASSSMSSGPAQSSLSTSLSAVSAGQNAQFMQAMRAQAPVVATPAEITEIIQTRLAGQDGGDKITVQLDPPELGRVSIDFKFDGQGLQHITITGETPEALKQLRQIHFQLTQALEQQGLSGQDMTFRQQSFSQQQNQSPQTGATGLAGTDGELAAEITTQAAMKPAKAIAPGTGLDMKV